MCRLNALVAVKRAGRAISARASAPWTSSRSSSSRSSTRPSSVGTHPDRDVYFSSKGHDVPGLYAALYALGVIPRERLLRLRRLGGLDGHPDVGVPGIEANSGSLGMGISKGRGIAWAKRHLGRGGRVVVMTGDGELQEGQNYEGLQAAAHERLAGLTVVVDRNELQSDKPTDEIVVARRSRGAVSGVRLARGDVRRARLRRAPWGVRVVSRRRTTGRRRSSRGRSRARASRSWSTPSRSTRAVARIAGTQALRTTSRSSGRSRSSSSESGSGCVARARAARARGRRAAEEPARQTLEGEPESGAGSATAKVTDEYVVEAYGDELVRARRASTSTSSSSTPTSPRTAACAAFELAYPGALPRVRHRRAGHGLDRRGLARHGLLPVVNSFASFLASRANEQIYNQASEGAKVDLRPVTTQGSSPPGPGKSHQSLRDISLLGALPNMAVVQPANSEETRALLAGQSKKRRRTSRSGSRSVPRRGGSSCRGYARSQGAGALLREGADAILFAYGPVMLHEALTASERLAERASGSRSSTCPGSTGSTRVARRDRSSRYDDVFVLEDHAPVGGLGDALRRELAGRTVAVFGVEGWPACGTPAEALRCHELDGASLAGRIASLLAERSPLR